MPTIQLLTGFLLATLVALAAWRLGALQPSGALAAALTGGLVFGFGGLAWAALLLVFFISSSALSKAFRRRKSGVGEKFSKGSRRDWAQVLANGGLGALLALLYGLLAGADWPWAAFAGAMAAANADTWATEIGVLSRRAPRLITTWKIVEMGTSGGITALGTLATLGGALLVGVIAALSGPGGAGLAVAATAGGLAGSLFDSWLGATVQAIYTCPVCKKETERHPQHTCGASTVLVRGLPWMNNDVVNFLCTAAGAVVAVVIYTLTR